ncbi:histidinol dehydrogenase [Methanocella sp. CWC-04]|uniref:Histidinol dehydrogenase n=1 Tax=Methanooceanicella nereidis TaxID=2052831 RepID=A0AAP2RBF1_9EURY|nr:histidinol dehydrogenase [Methanocella sp. CWC-04]MCD1294099.1 histidinol dehydrogenase [Methanocella sp. CWC-04]
MIRQLSNIDEDVLKELFKRRTSIESVMGSVKLVADDVRSNGDAAVKKYTKQFDGVDIESLEVTEDEIYNAEELIDYETIGHLEAAIENIQAFHALQLPSTETWLTEIYPGIRLGQKYTPLSRIGAYVPGGMGSYPSSALMLVIPARVAGVPEVIACTPPRKDGSIHPLTLTALDMAGADRIFKVGGVQAISAMAYGTGTIPKVEKIVGPGNIYVTAAKMYVRDSVEIDMPAGPSEIVVIADEGANPVFIAADMIAQGEHDVNAMSILLTTSRLLADAVENEIAVQTAKAARKEIIEKASKGIYVVKDLESAAEVCNFIAPEHVEIMVRDPLSVLNRVKNAGTVYVGEYAPVAAGDYASGANHVLPTGGYAKTFSGMNTMQFIKTTSIQVIDREGLEGIKDTIIALANIEGFDAHARSVAKRFE